MTEEASRLTGVGLHLVQSLDELDGFRRWLGERRPILGVDIETTGLSLAKDKIRLVQFGDTQHGWALPYEDYRGVIREVLSRYAQPIVLQHAKFDAGFLTRDGLEFPWQRTHDTMLMAFLVNSAAPKGLKPAAALYVDPMARAGEEELHRLMRRHGWDYATVPIDLPAYWGYGAMDTVLTAMLAEELWPRTQPFRKAYDLELACERVLCDVELRGIRIDVPYCEEQWGVLQQELVDVAERLGDVNPNAPQQIIGALARAGAPLTKRTAKGQLSVDDEVLSGLAGAFPIAGDVLRARHIGKLLGSYFENFLRYNNNDGRLNSHINQLAARTGRMSVTEPALQTIPREALVRDAFIPREGSKLVLCDYDNEELRVAAHFSGDATMLAAFDEGRDLHSETAERLYGPGYTKEQRNIAKACMFAKAYGAGVNKFAYSSGLPMHEATAVFRILDSLYPGLAQAMATTTVRIRDRAAGGPYGWVQLVDGRHLMVPADKPYMGFNYLIQGSCAVVLKQALVDLDLAGLGEHILLPIHDEIVFDVPEQNLDEIVPEIRHVMTRSDFRTPLTVGTEIVDRWGDKYRKEEGA